MNAGKKKTGENLVYMNKGRKRRTRKEEKERGKRQYCTVSWSFAIYILVHYTLTHNNTACLQIFWWFMEHQAYLQSVQNSLQSNNSVIQSPVDDPLIFTIVHSDPTCSREMMLDSSPEPCFRIKWPFVCADESPPSFAERACLADSSWAVKSNYKECLDVIEGLYRLEDAPVSAHHSTLYHHNNKLYDTVQYTVHCTPLYTVHHHNNKLYDSEQRTVY